MNGWNTSEMPTIMTAIGNIESLAYELRNCVRGCRSGCHSYDELKDYIHELGEILAQAADECDLINDEEDENDD